MTTRPPERRGLGRGLSALMSDVAPQGPDGAERRPDAMLAVDLLHPNSKQPRRHFAPEALEELAASIREKGILQPIIVRASPVAEMRYEIVAGERRWRAAQMARLHKVPVLIRELSDAEVYEIALIENIQRADLSPVEEAYGYRTLMQQHDQTQDRIAQALGKSRSHVANTLRLLALPDDVLALISQGKLSAGHARALIPLDLVTCRRLAAEAVAKNLSVRQVEALAKRGGGETAQPRRTTRRITPDADTLALEQDLSANLSMPVEIAHVGPGGAVTIRYADLEGLDILCRLLSAAAPRPVSPEADE